MQTPPQIRLTDRSYGLSLISCSETSQGLRCEFEIAVEDYLADCEEQGILPEKPENARIMLRVPPAVHVASRITLQASGKNPYQWAVKALETVARL